MNVEDMFNAGEAAMRQGKWADALLFVEKVLQQKPSHIHALYCKAQALSNLDRFKEAVNTYDELLKLLDPDSEYAAETMVSKGITLIELDKLEEADRCFDYCLQIKPRLARAWVHKGRVAARRKDFDTSAKCCDKAIALNPEDARAWNNKAYAMIQLSDPDECIRCAKKALDLLPSYFMAWLWLAKGYEMKGKLRKAKESMQKFRKYQQMGTPEHTVGLKPDNRATVRKKKWWWPF